MSRRYIAIAVACLGLCVAQARAAGISPHMELVPEEIVGVVLYPDGSTPVADLPIRVWNADAERMVFRARTDADGVFRIPEINPGRVFIYVGRLRIEVAVLDRTVNSVHQRHDIVVVVPRQLVYGGYPPVQDVLLLSGAAAAAELLVIPQIITPPDPPRVVSP